MLGVAVGAAVLLALGVGVSRIILRLHHASDVAPGFASGAAWLAVCITGIEFARWAATGRQRRHVSHREC